MVKETLSKGHGELRPILKALFTTAKNIYLFQQTFTLLKAMSKEFSSYSSIILIV